MVQLLSYAHMAIGGSKNMQVYNRMGSSVRKLLTGLANSKRGSMKFVATVQQSLPRTYAQASRSFEKTVEMKKGDWICARCSFMNFAKNSQCRQCDEHRPKKVLTGGEWECPECNFCNFGRNVVCLRCDCKRPGENQFLGPTSAVGLSAATSSVEGDTKRITNGIEKEQQWFTKIVELEKSSDMSNAVAYGDLPETMRAEDKSLNTSQSYPGIFSSDSQLERHNEPTVGLNTNAPIPQQMTREKSLNQLRDNDYVREHAEKSERLFNKVAESHEFSPDTISDDNFPETMPMRKGENQFVVGKMKDRSLTSPIYKRRVAMEQTGKHNYAPFVPFPPDYFAKDKPQDGHELTHSNESSNDVNQNPKTFASQHNSADDYSKSKDSSENTSVRASYGEKSLEGSAVKEPDLLDMSEEAKAERWFQRVAQIKDISELSQIPDEDFPSIMPMRKGVNRFVVSKRKTPLERRLTSPQYRRNLPAVGSDPIKKETDSNQES